MTSLRQVKNWYNKKHKNLGKEAWRPYEAYPMFLDYLGIGKKAKGKFLDIGCGTGYLLKAAQERGLDTYGMDLSDVGIKIAKKVSPRSKYWVGSGDDMKYESGQFDYLACIGVLEHFLDIKKGLREFSRVLDDDGKMCIVVPNKEFIYWKFSSEGTDQQDINEEILSYEDWVKMFKSCKLEVLDVFKDRSIVLKQRYPSLPVLNHVPKSFLMAAVGIIPLGYTYQFVFILGKK